MAEQTANRGYPLIVLSASPYAGSLARAALDLALSFAVFDRAPRLLFCGDGVLQLAAAQDADAIGRKSLRKVIDSLSLYDIETLYVSRDDLQVHGLRDAQLPASAALLDQDGVRQLRAHAGPLLSL